MDPTTKPKGQRVAYRRVSTLDQSTARQLDGMTFDREFTDKASGKDTARPALQEALAYTREGDTLVVHSMDRLARNLADLLRIVADLTNRKVKVEFVKENLTFTGEDSAIATLMLSIMGAVASFERSMILERQREGVALAKKAGRYKGRAPAIRAGNGKAAELQNLIAEKLPVSEIARRLGVSRQTIYSQLKNQPKIEEVAA
jgi:DNA invertase Pin-like site-specific DNA recombinase